MAKSINESKLNAFRELLGGRIVYSDLKKSLTIEYDFILYKTMNEFRSKGKTNWVSADQVKKQHLIHGLTNHRFCIYNNHLITRFYQIRKAIKDSNINFQVTG